MRDETVSRCRHRAFACGEHKPGRRAILHSTENAPRTRARHGTIFAIAHARHAASFQFEQIATQKRTPEPAGARKGASQDETNIDITVSPADVLAGGRRARGG